jgi:tRNA(His) 5'-end guanylyltransferase
MNLSIDQVKKLIRSGCIFLNDADETFYVDEELFLFGESDSFAMFSESSSLQYSLEGAKLEGVFVSFLSSPLGKTEPGRERVYFRIFQLLTTDKLIDLVA